MPPSHSLGSSPFTPCPAPGAVGTPQTGPDAARALAAVLAAAEQGAPYAVIARRGQPGFDLLVGDVVDVATLHDIPPARPGRPVLALVPFRQVAEREFACYDDGAPLRCLVATFATCVDRASALELLPDVPVLGSGEFTTTDVEYANLVRHVITDEIGQGEGANFVIRREFRGQLRGTDQQVLPPAQVALTMVRRLLLAEPNAYWAFAIHAGMGSSDAVTLVGATPERHISLADGTLMMNPVSGTYRYGGNGPDRDSLLEFLHDPKEIDELSMVVDEELKMMSELCHGGGQVVGPLLNPMSALAHTEYELVGNCQSPVREILRDTMFAATVTGSPVENACRVITKYEQAGRGYYGATAALFMSDADGTGEVLDSPILIRTAQLNTDGGFVIGSGTTIVRHSSPESETAETHAKAAGLVRVLTGRHPDGTPVTTDAPTAPVALAQLPGVAEQLRARNERLAQFWLQSQSQQPLPFAQGRTALVVDAEDGWTQMLAHLLRRLGMQVSVVRWDSPLLRADTPSRTELLAKADLLVSGPGPGDPRALSEPRIAFAHQLIRGRMAAGRPLLAVCLSHQIAALSCGLPINPLPHTRQGEQHAIAVLGQRVRVGFYNTFAAFVPPKAVSEDGTSAWVTPEGEQLTTWANPATGEVYALEGASWMSVQFHAESILSLDGVTVIREILTRLLGS